MGVECKVAFTNDHHWSTLENYSKQSVAGAVALWTTMTETNECPCAIIVPSVSIKDFAHAAESLARRPNFEPKAMWTDVYPDGSGFWKLLWPAILGHLGLFHWVHRIIKTLRKNHIHFTKSIADLVFCVYVWDPIDYKNVLRALKDGLMNNKNHSDDDITQLQQSGLFKKRYSCFLQKVIYPAETIVAKLDIWFCEYKATASSGKAAAGGQRDPVYDVTLFTPETKLAVEAGKKTAEHVPDKIPRADIYRKVGAAPRTKHGLPQYRSQRGESNLECMHGLMQHFANTGMRASLSDTINIDGIASFNCRAREKVRIEKLSTEDVARIPIRFRGTPLFSNHSKMAFVNDVAASVGVAEPVHKEVRPLADDNGELFFSEYFEAQKKRNIDSVPHPKNDRCQCSSCGQNPVGIDGTTVVFEEVSIFEGESANVLEGFDYNAVFSPGFGSSTDETQASPSTVLVPRTGPQLGYGSFPAAGTIPATMRPMLQPFLPSMQPIHPTPQPWMQQPVAIHPMFYQPSQHQFCGVVPPPGSRL